MVALKMSSLSIHRERLRRRFFLNETKTTEVRLRVSRQRKNCFNGKNFIRHIALIKKKQIYGHIFHYDLKMFTSFFFKTFSNTIRIKIDENKHLDYGIFYSKFHKRCKILLIGIMF